MLIVATLDAVSHGAFWVGLLLGFGLGWLACGWNAARQG